MSEDISKMVNTLKNLINNNSISDINNSSASSSTDSTQPNSSFNITPEMISEISDKLKNLSSENNNSSNQTSNETNSSQIDFETILKLKSIMEKLNKKDDPRSNLLHSLKPYLRESRQKKLDDYSNLLKIASLSDLFKN